MVYQFYNVTNSPLDYNSKISVTNFHIQNTILLKSFYDRSTPAPFNAAERYWYQFNIADYSFLLLLIHGLLGFHVASTRAVPHGPNLTRPAAFCASRG
jgi:hypothetical protein